MADSAISRLRAFGFGVDARAVEEMGRFIYSGSEARAMYLILQETGLGVYDFDTGVWTPTSRQVYSFDAEVFDIPHMYALFLQGVQAIVPDIAITEVTEDLSGVTEELLPPAEGEYEWTDGVRSVSFLCNGHPYSVELQSLGKWLNVDPMLVFMNGVLEAEGCPGRLHAVSHELDQMVILIYDTEERAEQLRQMISPF